MAYFKISGKVLDKWNRPWQSVRLSLVMHWGVNTEIITETVSDVDGSYFLQSPDYPNSTLDTRYPFYFTVDVSTIDVSCITNATELPTYYLPISSFALGGPQIYSFNSREETSQNIIVSLSKNYVWGRVYTTYDQPINGVKVKAYIGSYGNAENNICSDSDQTKYIGNAITETSEVDGKGFYYFAEESTSAKMIPCGNTCIYIDADHLASNDLELISVSPSYNADYIYENQGSYDFYVQLRRISDPNAPVFPDPGSGESVVIGDIEIIDSGGGTNGGTNGGTTEGEEGETDSIYCLTTIVDLGEGTIRQPGCLNGDGTWTEYSLGESGCAADFVEGESITIKARPASGGWVVKKWNTSVPVTYTSISADKENITIEMPSSDVTVSVEFEHSGSHLTLEVGGGQGCIELKSPDPSIYWVNKPCSGGTVALPGTEVTILADPSNGYGVQKWEVNGVDQSSTALQIDVSMYVSSPVTVTVYFEEQECTKNYLEVEIIGKGKVSPSTGYYCDYTTQTLNPIPSSGYYFSEWRYTDNDVYESGISLIVPMTTDRNVTAIFRQRPDHEETDYTMFYCPSSEYESGTIDFSFANNAEIDSNATNKFHFRVTIFSDSAKSKVVLSSFSATDTKRWYYDDGAFRKVNTSGVTVLPGETMDITYDPEVLPSSLSENQKDYLLNNDGNSITERPLICGAKYYVDIEVYDIYSLEMRFLETISLTVDCDNVDTWGRDVDADRKHWLCSAQGGTDLRVTSDNSPNLFSTVRANDFNMFRVVWQTRRSNGYKIYGAHWISDSDLLYCSGQGMYDEKMIDRGLYPNLVVDIANNFYVSSHDSSNLYYHVCPMSTSIPDIPEIDEGSDLESICYPGTSILLGSSVGNLSMRVYEQDTDGSLVVSRDKVIPVVTKQDIRLEINSLPGAYALRLRGAEDLEWNDWINIDEALYYETGTATQDDQDFDAYSIDGSRVVVPWKISKINGIRRICCQILTSYGISRTFCIEFFVNIDISEYFFRFYKDQERTISVPSYNGYPILSLFKSNEGDNANTADGLIEYNPTTIYFSAVFTKEQSYDISDLSFNVIQTGVDDIFDKAFTSKEDDNKTYHGDFQINKDDGVFNKDGKGFIQIVFPDDVSTSICESDTSDIYNLVLNENEAAKYQNLDPEEIYLQVVTNKIGKALDLNSFQQYYNVDDSSFLFGKPDYFRNDKQE